VRCQAGPVPLNGWPHVGSAHDEFGSREPQVPRRHLICTSGTSPRPAAISAERSASLAWQAGRRKIITIAMRRADKYRYHATSAGFHELHNAQIGRWPKDPNRAGRDGERSRAYHPQSTGHSEASPVRRGRGVGRGLAELTAQLKQARADTQAAEQATETIRQADKTRASSSTWTTWHLRCRMDTRWRGSYRRNPMYHAVKT
jgi:hypothetical protein